MTYFIELLKGWDGHKKGAVLEVGKSTVHALTADKKAKRVPDPSKAQPAKPKKKKGLKKKLWNI